MARIAEFPDETFSAMQHIRETALIRFDSLFTPERKLRHRQAKRRISFNRKAAFVADQFGNFRRRCARVLEGLRRIFSE